MPHAQAATRCTVSRTAGRYNWLNLHAHASLPEALALSDRVLFLSTGPSRVMLDYAIPTPRSGDLTSAAVMALQQDLLGQHPLLLQGAMGLGVAPSN